VSDLDPKSEEQDDDGTFDLADEPEAPAEAEAPGKLGGAFALDAPGDDDAGGGTKAPPPPVTPTEGPGYEVPKYVDSGTASRKRDESRKAAEQRMLEEHAREQKKKFIKLAVFAALVLIGVVYFMTGSSDGEGEEGKDNPPAKAKP